MVVRDIMVAYKLLIHYRKDPELSSELRHMLGADCCRPEIVLSTNAFCHRSPESLMEIGNYGVISRRLLNDNMAFLLRSCVIHCILSLN